VIFIRAYGEPILEASHDRSVLFTLSVNSRNFYWEYSSCLLVRFIAKISYSVEAEDKARRSFHNTTSWSMRDR
jgi:hypothetical protein